jgi:hypothetical protein
MRVSFRLSLLDADSPRLLDIATLHDSRKRICQLVHHNFGQIITRDTRNIAVAHGILRHQNIISQTCSITGGSGNTDVCLRVQSQHSCRVRHSASLQKLTIYPVNTIFAPASPPKYSCKSVSANELGWFLPITFSPSFGASSSNSFASFESGVKTGAPLGVWCTTCTTLLPASRYFCSRPAIALRDEDAFVTLSLPSAYSFCASMMMRVLLLGEAVEGEAPTIWRKDWTAIVEV